MTMKMTIRPSRRFAFWLWVVLALCGAASSARENGLLTAGSNVLVLTGLPGDVESESAYQSELERLLEVLALPGMQPGRIVVLNDAGDAGSVPPGLAVAVRSGHRQAFLDVAEELGSSEQPLTVFVWGHGGLQGRDPVFHVRGPRLQPADFRALADRVQGPSRWVLVFRHSGAFARALRAPEREVLSSENATAFKSDPASVDLLLGILRASPQLSLTELAEKLGPATTAWYEEQHLARQEEPTLWIGEEPPRDLADATSAEPSPEPQTTEPTSASLSATWHGIERVDAERYPDASAVVLRRTLRYVLADNPALESESDELIQVLTPEGTAHGDFDIAYHPPGEKITFLDLEVLRPDGTVLRLAPDQVRDATPEALPEYRPATRKVFSLPQAVPGSILRVHYRREWRRFPLPHVPLEIPLTGSLPAAESTIEVRVDREAPLHYAFRRRAPYEPAVRETPYGKTYTWTFQDLGAMVAEVLAAPQSTPTLLVSTFPSWDAFADWYRRLIRTADELTPEVAAKAAELTAGDRTDREKVESLYNFVTGLRYVAIPFGVNSHRPHAAANVFANRYGDCKDKANLFNTMLTALGIEADLVLVPRFSQAYEATPGLGFNHAISRVRLEGEVIWADTTDDVARFGLLPPGDPGRNVLVIHEAVSGLTALPTPRPEDHRLSLRSEIRLRHDDEPAASELEITTAGFPDYALRSLARAVGSTSGSQPIPLVRLQPSSGYFAMTEQRHTSVAALDRAFSWRGEGEWTGLTVDLGEDVLVRAPFLLPADWRLALHERTLPLYLNRGYPLTLTQELVFVLPRGAEPVRLPKTTADAAGPLQWRVEWERDGPQLAARLEVVLDKGELDRDETVAFRDGLRRLYTALGRGAVVASKPTPTEDLK